MIIIDIHEPEYFKEKAMVDNLQIGDYLVQGEDETHMFERKTASDFFSTLMHRENKEAMWNVLKGLCEYRDVHGFNVYIIIEGDMAKEMKMHHYPYMLWVGVRRAIITGYHIPIVHTFDKNDTWTFLKALDKHLTEPKEYIRPPPIKKAGRNIAECQEDIICSAIDMLGRKKAQALLEQFGSVHSLINAQVEEITEVKGIGKKTAQAFYDVINEKYRS